MAKIQMGLVWDHWISSAVTTLAPTATPGPVLDRPQLASAVGTEASLPSLSPPTLPTLPRDRGSCSSLTLFTHRANPAP